MKRFVLLFAALAVLAGVACEESAENPVAPPVTFDPSGNEGTATATQPAAEPEATDPCEGDASCGRGIEGQFDAKWTLKTTSTKRSASSGHVCMTDGFQGPGVGRYPWSNPGTTTSAPSVVETPFDISYVKIDDWKEGECERQVQLQLDAYRGDSCSGWILQPGGVIYPGPGTVRTVRNPGCSNECEPGEWRPVGEPSLESEGEWGPCDLEANVENHGCYECRTVTYSQTFINGCQDEVRTWEETERRETDCPSCDSYPVPDVTVEWEIVEQETEGGILAAGHHCNAIYSGVVITPSICAPPFDIAPPLPHLVPSGTSQLFTFSWAGVYEPAEGLRCPISGQETDLVEAPEVGQCFYEVSCARQGDFQASTFCSYFDKKDICESKGGSYLDTNPNPWVVNFQCVADLPGIEDFRFELTPGQSAPGCIKNNGPH